MVILYKNADMKRADKQEEG